MYRCEACNRVSPPHQIKLVHRILRQVPVVKVEFNRPVTERRTEIVREVAVCPECKRDLETGATLKHLQRLHADNFTPPPPPLPGPREPVTPPRIVPLTPIALEAPAPRTLD